MDYSNELFFGIAERVREKLEEARGDSYIYLPEGVDRGDWCAILSRIAISFDVVNQNVELLSEIMLTMYEDGESLQNHSKEVEDQLLFAQEALKTTENYRTEGYRLLGKYLECILL